MNELQRKTLKAQIKKLRSISMYELGVPKNKQRDFDFNKHYERVIEKDRIIQDVVVWLKCLLK